ncbi:LamG-like jellyroll fold domain-containing protein [Verrucomicrobiaceae bacterium 227]
MNTHTFSIVAALFGVGICHAEVLGFKFLDANDTPIPAASTAGAGPYAQANWNLLQTDYSGSDANDAIFTALVNSTGTTTSSLQTITYAAHADPVHYDSNNTWRSGAGNVDANATLMNGYLDDGLDNQPYVNFSLADGSFPNYTIVLYVNGDGQNAAVGRYWVEEWTDPLAEGVVITDQVGISSNGYDGTFVQAGGDFPQTADPQNVDVATGNYIVFTNLTARNVRVRAAGNGDPEDFGRGPLNAVQILDTVIDPDGDSDDDGLLNGWEATYGLDPNSDQGDDGASGDPDSDNLTNLEEQALGTNPVDDDSDNDGLKDGVETGGGTWNGAADTGTNPLMADSDMDGLLDGVEDNSGSYTNAMNTGSNPNVLDTDADGLPDGWEVAANLDPNDDGTVNVVNGPLGDPDSDSSNNADEFARGTDAADNDTDDDTLLDGYEDLGGVYVSATETGTDPLNMDSDGDTLSDGAETADGIFVNAGQTGSDPNLHDTDSDGYFDEQEVAAGTDPNNPSDKPAFHVPIGYWSFDDQGVGTTADLSPNGNNGVVIGGATYAAGHTGSPTDFSISLDGVDDAVTTPLTLSNIGYFTMAGWVKFENRQADRAGLFGQNDILEFGFSVGSTDTVQLWSNPGGAIETTLAPSDWTHIAFVGDGTGRTIYLNGVEAVRGAAASPLNASNFFFNIGGGGVFDDTGNYFAGQMDDVAVWDVSMGPQLIAGLAAGTLTPIPSLSGNLAISSIERPSDNKVTFTIDGTIPNVTYSIQHSSDLENWSEADDFTGAEGENMTEVTLTLFPPVPAKRFYYVTPVE